MNRCWHLLPILFPILVSAQQDSLPLPIMTDGHRFTMVVSPALIRTCSEMIW